MTPECPYCKWYMRTMDKTISLYECSNPNCAIVIQFPMVVDKKLPKIKVDLWKFIK